jgi:hypothetical protein
MKILIFYTPRSKSTFLQEILSTKYKLESIVDPFVYSKMKHGNKDEFPKIVDEINTTENICVKISSTDFLDSKNREVHDYYKDINYQSFDKIVFVSRKDILSGSLSCCHMDLKDNTSWHSTKDKKNNGRTFTVDIGRLAWYLRGYRIFDFIKDHIIKNFDKEIYEYDYDNLEEDLKKDFELSAADLDTNLIANEIDYKPLAVNLDRVEDFIKNNVDTILNAPCHELNSYNSKFWTIDTRQ